MASRAELAGAMGPDGALVEPRLARGCRAFAGTIDGHVVAYAWLSTGPEWIGELGLEIQPGPGEAYIWNCVTLPARRQQGVFRAMLHALVQVAHDDGLQRLWIGGVDGGAESAVVESGFARVLHLTAYTLAGRRWLRVAAAPGADATTVRDALFVLGGARGRLRSGLRRVQQRRH